MKSLIRQTKSDPCATSGKLYEQLIQDYSPLVHYVARNIARKIPAHIDVNDLISEGLIGLMDAIQKFEVERNISFRTYAEYRIRGAILDSLRAQDWVPRSVRDRSKELELAHSKLETLLGRSATDRELADELRIDLNDLHALRWKAMPAKQVSEENCHELPDTKPSLDPQASLIGKHFHQFLLAQIASLNDDRKLVLSLYYYEQLTMKEIGKILGVSESRVCQIHRDAVAQMRTRMQALNL